MAGRSYFAGLPPRVIAHRGLALTVPGNTLAAFAAALEAGADILETDVRATSDRVAVLAHDDTVVTADGRRVLVADATARRLAALDLGGGQGVPTLAELLAAFPRAAVNLDVKSDDAVAPTVRAILDAAATRRVLVTSFDGARRRRAVAGLPGVATSGSRGEVVCGVIGAKVGLARVLARTADGIDALQLPERAGPVALVTPLTVAAWRDALLEVHVWTVNDPARMAELVSWGVAGIITDRADLARRTLDGWLRGS